jgi:tetratricopeptide (TPR) repeat protein
MRKYFLTIAMTILSYLSFACGNEYYRTELPLDNDKLNIRYLLNEDFKSGALPYWTHGFNNGSIQVNPKSLLNSYSETKDFKYLSDYAWELVKEGKANEAIIILDSLLKSHPNEYNILANLGTAYEIKGENKKALELLTKAVSINKNSHYGSEWIHLNILKHKIDKEAFPIENIINLGINGNKSQWNTNKWTYPIPADTLLKSIAYQLHERIGFIAPKDAIIGRLIFDFAEIIAKTKSKEDALPFYDYAMYYDNELYRQVLNAKQIPTATTTTITRIEELPSENKRYQFLILASFVLTIVAFFVGRKTAKNK